MAYRYLFLSLLFLFSACEEVIDLDLQTQDPKLVIDAAIQWQKGTSGAVQTIKLSTTTSFFSNDFPTVSGATVQLINSQNAVFEFLETNPGDYVCNNFVPEINENYLLRVVYQNETYEAEQRLLPTPNILPEVEQDNEAGVLGEDIALKFFFQDFVNEENFYKFRFDVEFKATPNLGTVEDRFVANNLLFVNLFSTDQKSGQLVKLTLTQIDRNYFNYLRILLNVAGSNSGSPFQAPPGTVRGNIVNKTNQKNFPLGYFYAAETDVKEYVVQ